MSTCKDMCPTKLRHYEESGDEDESAPCLTTPFTFVAVADTQSRAWDTSGHN